MKKRFLSTICAVLVLCAAGLAKSVSPNRAAAVAERFLIAKGIAPGKLVLHENRSSGAAHSHEQSAVAPTYYIFRAADTGGFVIVSGDDIARPVLGYALDGTMTDDSKFPLNMQEWLDDMERQIQQARSLGIQQSAETAALWQAPDADETIVQLETALWKQQDPFNQQCPLENGDRCLTGCVATAYAILMKYYQYPSGGTGTTDSYIVERNGVVVPGRNLEHAYHWDLMPLEYPAGQYTQAEADAVAELMADIGAVIQSNYGASETTANINHEGIFSHFGFNPGTRQYKEDYTNDEWNTMLKAQLGKLHPVLYRGAVSEDESGHAFLLVGYTSQDYYLINWGWGGNHNGAFALDALKPGKKDYTSSQQAYFDCMPATMLPPVAIVNDTYEVPSLRAALAIASTDGAATHIKMTTDASVSNEKIKAGSDVLLDLNGRTLTVVHHGIKNYGRLTVTDTNTNSTGKLVLKSGNSGIISNYGELWVESGELLNKSATVGDTDYRRCVWSTQESTTFILGGVFSNDSRSQTLCFNGDATVSGGIIENKGTGLCCASNAYVTITDCKMAGKRNVYTWTGGTLKCSGGLYSQMIADVYLAQGCYCTYNEDEATKEKYPFRVVNPDGIGVTPQADSPEGICYGLDGIVRTAGQSVLNIVRRQSKYVLVRQQRQR